jgi:glycosyltransferase involved in cell wall biosynthesis
MVLPSTTPPLRILLSAYSCEPGKGSEPGVGWHWAVEMARLGHCVSVLTRQNNREAIELALGDANAKTYASNLSFIYYDLPAWARWWKRNGRGVHLYYLLWQIGAYGVARKAHLRHAFEAVHHLTFGVLRQPSLMGRMGIPFVIGPLGGGESTPPMLRRFFPFRSRVREWARDMGNFVCRYDPLVRGMYRDAGVVLCKTPESLAWVPERYRSHSRCMLEIGIDAKPELPDLAESAGSELRLVYVGRFLALKGMDIGLRALAQLRAHGTNVTLTMIGSGPEASRWRALAVELGIDDAITWIPWMKQDDLMNTYASYDALLFPSLHDSSGNVVLEAMAHGLPVVCLDLGGPAQMVNEHCGIVVGTQGKTAEQVVDALSGLLETFSRRPVWRAALRTGARSRASNFAWHTVVARVWSGEGVGSALVKAERDRSDQLADAGAHTPRYRPLARRAEHSGNT